MSPLGFHLVFRLEDDRVFAPSPASRRRLARVLSRLTGAFGLLAWRAADTHVHLVGLVTEAEVVELARRLRISLAQTLHPGVPLLLSRPVPLRDQWHASEAFTYVLRQDRHHGLGSDPLQEGSSVLDLLGMRMLSPMLPGRVREHLPRVGRGDLLAHLGVAALDEAVHVQHLVDAACAAFALPDLTGRDADTVAARTASVHAAKGMPTAVLAATLCVTSPGIRKMAARTASPRAIRAIRLQMALRASVPFADVAFVREPAVPVLAATR